MLLPPDVPPRPQTPCTHDDWSPFSSQADFLIVDFLFWRVEMSAGNINDLLELWACQSHGQQSNPIDGSDGAPFRSASHLYATIDAIQSGGVPWECMKVSPNIDLTKGEDIPPAWKTKDYEVWYCDVDRVIAEMLDNPDFKDQFDTCPFIYTNSQGHRRWTDFMSGNYAWRQSVGTVQ